MSYLDILQFSSIAMSGTSALIAFYALAVLLLCDVNRELIYERILNIGFLGTAVSLVLFLYCILLREYFCIK